MRKYRVKNASYIRKDVEKKIETEREKLDILVDEALENGTPISQTYDIMAQCKKIRLLEEIMNGAAIFNSEYDARAAV